jgi:saccharopine dehydrogenase-like NADP-dependent oxidoreductase
MKNIVIVGAGRVGCAMSHMLAGLSDIEVTVLDKSAEALEGCSAERTFVAANATELKAAVRASAPFVVVCCTPFTVNIQLAKLCAELKCHYIDFTEDVSVTKAIRDLAPTESTFILQTGLAPGLVTSIGMHLLDALEAEGLTTLGLKQRVGALPQVGELPAAYALTWSSEGLINEYYQPVERIKRGELFIDEPLTDHERLIINGEELEAFNTSGGLGDPSMYLKRGLDFADYKTMRYPGHLAFLEHALKKPLQDLSGTARIERGVELATRLFPYTRDDVVYLAVRAYATGSGNWETHEKSYTRKFKAAGGLTALELTTSGTGVACVELLLGDELPRGIVFGGEVPFLAIQHTYAWLEYMAEDAGVLTAD